jgi:hypothetical protein
MRYLLHKIAVLVIYIQDCDSNRHPHISIYSINRDIAKPDYSIYHLHTHTTQQMNAHIKDLSAAKCLYAHANFERETSDNMNFRDTCIGQLSIWNTTLYRRVSIHTIQNIYRTQVLHKMFAMKIYFSTTETIFLNKNFV